MYKNKAEALLEDKTENHEADLPVLAFYSRYP